MAKWNTGSLPVLDPVIVPAPDQSSKQPADARSEWGKDTCPNCGYSYADVDVEGVLWCPACGYSKKGCYT